MSKARTWTFGAIALMLVVVIAGWMLGISPIFTQISATTAQTASIQTSNVSTQEQLGALTKQFATISTLQANLATLRLSIPEQAAASAFINEVTGLASDNKVTLKSVTIADAAVYVAPGTSATATTPTGTSTATPAPTATAATTTTTPTTATTPTVASNGLISIPVVVSVSGSLTNSQSFVDALQTGSRLFVSSTLTIASVSAGGSVSAGITGDIFSLQGSSDTPTADTPPTVYNTASPIPTSSSTSTAVVPTSTPTSTSGTTTTTTKPKKPKSTTPATPNPVGGN